MNPLTLQLINLQKIKTSDLIIEVLLPLFFSTTKENKINNVGSTTEQIYRLTWCDRTTADTPLKSALSHLLFYGMLPSRNCAANVEYASALKRDYFKSFILYRCLKVA